MFKVSKLKINTVYIPQLSDKVVVSDGTQKYVCDSASGAIRVHSDPYFLMNNLAPTQDSALADAWLQNLDVQSHSSDMQKLLGDGYKDKLASMVKSRFIQSPSELKSYLQNMMDEQDYLAAEAEIQKMRADETTSVVD